MSMHEKYDAKIKAQAEDAYKQIYAIPEAVEQAKAVRARVYRWLESIEAKCSDPKQLLPDVTADKLSVDLNIDKGTITKVVSGFLAVSGAKCCLMSRQENELQWTPTSFFYDGEVQSLNVKIGNNPYQPIGFDDGTILVQFEATKLLWARYWSIAASVPLSSPFHIAYNPEKEAMASNVFLVAGDLDGLRKAFKELEEELGEYISGKLEDRQEAEYRLRETVKLARIISQVLDAKLKLVLRERSGLGPNFENADIAEVAKASLEYIAARLDAHEAAKRIAQSELVIIDDATMEKLRPLIRRLRVMLISSVVDYEALDSLLSLITTTCGPAATKLESLTNDNPIERAKDFYDWLAAVCSLDVPTAASHGANAPENSHGPVSGPAGSAAPAAGVLPEAVPGQPGPVLEGTSAGSTPAAQA